MVVKDGLDHPMSAYKNEEKINYKIRLYWANNL